MILLKMYDFLIEILSFVLDVQNWFSVILFYKLKSVFLFAKCYAGGALFRWLC